MGTVSFVLTSQNLEDQGERNNAVQRGSVSHKVYVYSYAHCIIKRLQIDITCNFMQVQSTINSNFHLHNEVSPRYFTLVCYNLAKLNFHVLRHDVVYTCFHSIPRGFEMAISQHLHGGAAGVTVPAIPVPVL